MYTQLIDEIMQNKYQVHGIEVFQNGATVFSHYFDPDVPYPIYSATKSFTATAVGFAAGEGKLSIENPLSAYLRQKDLQHVPKAQREAFCHLPIKRFLAMSVAGYPFRPEGEDYLRFALECPMNYHKAPEFSYSNIPAYLVGVAVSNAVGMHLIEYLTPRLFEPLGIAEPIYQNSPEGYFYGASGMHLTVHELSLLGRLYLQEGVWQGKQILTKEWVREATGIQQKNREGGYGYFFWKYGEGYRISGKWGQRCLILPKHSLMITYLSNMPEDSHQVTKTIERHVISTL